MSPFVCYHATSRANRHSIRRRGLVAHRPSRQGQPRGVYAYCHDLCNPPPHEREWFVRWTAVIGMDIWQIAWIGPMRPDPLVQNSVVLPSVTDVTLVTRNSKDHALLDIG